MSRPLVPPVVAAVDRSPQARPTARAAAREAVCRHTDLHLVHVEGPFRTGLLGGGPSGPAGELLHEHRHRASEQLLAELASSLSGLLPPGAIGTEAVAGRPAEVLVERSADAALLVLGGRPEEGLGGLRLGSTASAVVAHARCPVLVLPDGPNAVLGMASSVVAGVAGDPTDAEVLAVAFEEAAARGTDLTVVHAWIDPVLEPSWKSIGPLIDWDGVREEEQRLLAEVLAGWQEKWPDVVVRPVLVRQKRARAMIGAATAAELLVIGHRHRRLAALGSTTREVLHRAGCPVIVVPLGTGTEVR